MPNLLVIYEIAARAAAVRSKRSFREFERWVKEIIERYHDAAVERVARVHLLRLRQLY